MLLRELPLPRAAVARSIAAVLLLAGAARAQAVFLELEPNSTKAEATPIACMSSGDLLVGVTTGGLDTPGDVGLGTADVYRIRTCPSASGLHRHELALTSASPGQTATLRGLVQTGTPGVGGAPTTIDAAVATAVGNGTGASVLAWYGWGASEEVYYRVTGLPGTPQLYVATLTSTAVAPVELGNFLAGPVTITTEGQGHLTDTDLWLYDANGVAIPLAGNDDVYPSPSVQSRLARTLAPGTYHLAVAAFNLANDRTSPADDDFVQGNLLDFPGATATSQTVANLDVSFAISDAGHTVAVPAQVNAGRAHEIAWFRFEVVAPAFEPYCFGDGTQVEPCPCGNVGGPGRGCANSTSPAGALLVATGTTSADDVVLTSSGMPSLAYAIFLKGDATIAGQAFGDGVRCVSGELIRLRLKLANAGVASFPELGDPSLSQRGQTPPGSASVAWYQAYYRNAAALFCPPETFNVTNGWRAVW